MTKITWKAEQAQKMIAEQHGYRSTLVLCMEELRKTPGATPDDIISAVAQRCNMILWLLDSGGSVVKVDDIKALQWACHVGRVSEFEYGAVTGKHPDAYVPSQGVKPWTPLQERHGVLVAFSGPGGGEAVGTADERQPAGHRVLRRLIR